MSAFESISPACPYNTLAADAAVGASSISLANLSAVFQPGIVVAINVGTPECELRIVSAVIGSTVSFSPVLLYSHSSGSLVVPILDASVPTMFFGCKADGSTDDWQGLQHGIIETARLGIWLTGMTFQHNCGQPLITKESHLRDITIRCAAGFAPVDAAPSAMVMNCQDNPQSFTALASNDTFTTPANHGTGAGNMICFNAPNGESLPGGITAGHIYFIKTTPAGNTFTISETQGGATFNVSADGAGWCYPDLLSTSRVFFENVTLQVNSNGVVGLNGLSACVQQPGYTNKLRVDVGTGIGVNMYIGQISMHHNMEIVQGGAGTGLLVSGSGHCFFGLDVIGSGTLVDDQAVGTEIHGLWLENQVTGMVCGVNAGVGAIYDIQQFAPETASNPMILNDSADNSFAIRGPRLSGSTYTVLEDTARSITLIASDFPSQGPLHLIQNKGATSGPGPLYGSAALNFDEIAAGATAELTVTVNGAIAEGHKVVATPANDLEDGIMWNAYVSAADTVTVRLANVTASPINPANRSWYVTVLP